MAVRRLRMLLLLVVVCFVFAPQPAQSILCGPTSVTTCPGRCLNGECTDYGTHDQGCKLQHGGGCNNVSCYGGCP